MCSSQSLALAVALQEVEPVVEAAHRRKIGVVADELAVDHVLRELVPALAAELHAVVLLAQALPRRLDHRLPRIALLPAHEFERVVAVVVRGAAVLPVVVVVGHEVRVHALPVQDLGERVVERLERSPRAVQERQPAGVHVAPRGHARQAADVMVVERDAALREALEVGRLHGAAAVAFQRTPVERIEQHEDHFHGAPSAAAPRFLHEPSQSSPPSSAPRRPTWSSRRAGTPPSRPA